MGVYIPNMEMPKNCTFCEMWHNIDCHPYQGISPPKSRPDHCPLISVPPHGRLIDADAVKAEWEHGFYKKIVDALMDDAPTIIEAEPCNDLAKPNNAPTIIPADGGET